MESMEKESRIKSRGHGEFRRKHKITDESTINATNWIKRCVTHVLCIYIHIYIIARRTERERKKMLEVQLVRTKDAHDNFTGVQS